MKLVKLDSIANISSGQSAPKKKSDFSKKGIPFIRAGSLNDLLNGRDESDLELVNRNTIENYRLKIYDKNTIVFAKSGMSATKDRYYKLKGKCCVVSHLCVVEPKETVDPQFLLYSLRNRPASILINDLAYPSLSITKLKRHEIPFTYSLSSQQRIAQVLSDCEDLIIKRKESIALLDELVKSTFLEMFGDPVRNENGWLKEKLKYVCNKITDGTHHSPPIVEDGVPYITAKHIDENTVDFWSKPWFVSQENHEKIFSRCDPAFGDVLYIKDGATTGRAAINPYDFEFSMLSSVALLKPNLDIALPTYITNWLNHTVVKKKIISKMAGGAIKRLTLKKINQIEILIPPLELQLQFQKFNDKVIGLKEDYISSLQLLEQLFNRINQDAFKGDLDLAKLELNITEFQTNFSFDLDEVKVSVEKPSKTYLTKKRLAQIIKSSFGKNDFSIETLRKLISEKFENQSQEELKSILKDMLEAKKIEQTYNQKEKQITFRIANEA